MSDEESKAEETSSPAESGAPDVIDTEEVIVAPEPEPEAAQDPEPEPEAEPKPEAESEAEPEVEAEAEPEPDAALPVTAAFEPEALEPPRKHTGLIVVVASLVLLLAAFVFVGPLLYRAVLGAGSSASSVAPAKAKITIGIGFVEALLNGDTLAIKPFLQDSAQSAITDAQWKELAAQDATPAVTFGPPTFSGDAKAVVNVSAQDTTGTLTFTVDAAKPLSVVMTADIAGTTEVDTVGLVQVGSGWRVLSITNGTDTTTFDATLVKSMIPTDTAQ